MTGRFIPYTLVATALMLAVFLTPSADAEFVFIGKWGESGYQDGGFSNPKDIAVDSDGYVYVADTSHYRVQKFDPSGTHLESWESIFHDPIDGYDPVIGPLAIATGPRDNVFVAEAVIDVYEGQTDPRKFQIRKLDPHGDVIAEWGNIGTDDSQFLYPFGIALGRNGHIYVSDMNNDRVQKFKPEGNEYVYDTQWGEFCEVNVQDPNGCDSGFHHPAGVDVDSNGYVYVVDSQNDRIQKFDSNGGFVSTLGSECKVNDHPDDKDFCDGMFNFPFGLAVDRNDNVYVADMLNNRIQVFDPNGKFLEKWGSRCDVDDQNPDACDGRFLFPYGLDIDPSKGTVFVADTANNRIQKFEQLSVMREPALERPVSSPPPLSSTTPIALPKERETRESVCNLKITSPRINTGKSNSVKLSKRSAQRLFTKGLKGHIGWGKAGGKRVVCKNVKMAIIEKRGKRFFLPGTKTRVSKKYLSSKSFPTKGARFLKKKKAGKLSQKRQLKKRQTKFAFKPFSRRSRIGRRALRSLKRKGYRGTFVVVYTAKVGKTTVKKTITLKVSRKK